MLKLGLNEYFSSFSNIKFVANDKILCYPCAKLTDLASPLPEPPGMIPNPSWQADSQSGLSSRPFITWNKLQRKLRDRKCKCKPLKKVLRYFDLFV